MFISNIMPVLTMLFFVSLIGYILVVLKEKLFLSDNTIIIGKKAVTQEHINETDMKVFTIGGIKIKSGDEVRLVLLNNNKIDGIVIGAKAKEKELMMVTYKDEIKAFEVKEIRKIKVISKYGRFFK
ncbi:hypothetical protein SAMN05660462_02084 [Proteiniborus ethanoligenes]|uniref:Uncharacterized protein n=1 Tax=Proteiniborus ethanoligenes TaxID=415015 RepID=A0A1H3QSV0_9FIRM|nr:hypothetical protein [Proteiniborus ethanoligenes]TAH60072.1 MAG: hypothetical protein EWM50_06935 [Gottschalkiaceae bacterium]SDZ16594.1 hypothetical protein SAMN05660462_02084 [Proteiniborus ethanoligenes]